ncbi:hypothetical protein H9L10_07140 [Phycicoccus endophyticus]|uniref:Uncharacterized protein n=1 Tax=Phycicoccus endophyticus TaxID=1690220 RepID=A0A7G9R529_9MICO|nr:hypothetical protein [Phycicoccus endophyticus]NHI20891.1 hypothetical protein [Phycicoccus endophyticus]QNN50704.1 hypothetical protein H9L10_07140 [Phycicoccus endophyticus]GGL22154.1 hypothetical protein GCM10012283_00260 [Phycicoccus endophyticus]
MTWLGVWLVGVGLADLVRASPRPAAGRWAPALGVAAMLVTGAAAGLLGAVDLVVAVGAALALVLWVRWSQEALGSGRGHAAALCSLAAGAAWLVALSGWASAPGGVLGRWLAWAQLPAAAAGADPGRVLLVTGLVLANLATGNVIVRLVLVSIGALRPARPTLPVGGPEPAEQLRGGRLLGPMERVLVLGLGLAGQLTAAGLVIAAKGLIRFPELQATRSERESVDGLGIDAVTEYFLVGSFVSWLVALASLALSR